MNGANGGGKPLHIQNKMAPGAYVTGTLANATPVVIPMAGAPLPATVCLSSADATRKIEFSCDDGVSYQTATYAVDVAGQRIAKIDFSVSHVRITGIATNTYSIR